MTEDALPGAAAPEDSGLLSGAIGGGTVPRKGFALRLYITYRLLTYVRPYAVRFVLMLALTALTAVTRISGIVLIKPFGDIILGTFDTEVYAQLPGLRGEWGTALVERFAHTLSDSPQAALVLLVQLLLGLILAQTFSNFGAVYLQINLGGRVSRDLQETLLKNLLHQPLDYYRNWGKGLLHQVVALDTAAAFRTLYVIFNRLIRGPIEAAAMIAIALTIDWKLTLFAAAVLPVIALIVHGFNRRLRKQEADAAYYGGLSSIILQEILGAPLVVKAYQMEHFFIEKFSHAVGKRFRIMMGLRKSREWMGPLTDMTVGAALAGFVYINGRALINHQLDLPSFALLYACLGSLLNPIRKAARGYGELVLNFLALERVFHLLDATPAIADDPAAAVLDGVNGHIEYRGVTFGYDPELPVLHDVSFTVQPGERVAFVGPSGGGKTTTAHLLLRLYEPQQGCILIDGKDVRTVTIESLRRHVGLVTQETGIFSATVRENIAAGRPDPAGTLVVEAARAARADEFISQLPNGYDTRLGDMGQSVSGGQQQRIAIARALFRDTPILILDEASSALDAESEREMHAEVLSLMEGRTLLIIAHRLSTILHADRVLLIYQGRVAAQGTHADLLAASPLYRQLFEQQMLSLIDDTAAPEPKPV